MARKVELDFQDGVGFRNISSFTKYDTLLITKRACSENFHFAQNEASFDIVYDATIYELLRYATKNILVRITEDGTTSLFYGYSEPTKSRTYNGILNNIIWTIQAKDEITLLDVPIGDICYTNFSIMNPASPTTSLVHQLAYRAGFSAAKMGAVTISGTIAKFAPNSEDDSILDILDTLLFEYQHVLNIDAAGLISPLKWVNSGISEYTFNDSNMQIETVVEDTTQTYYGAEVTYYELAQAVTVSGGMSVRLYTDDNCTYDDAGTFTGYTILPGTTYPPLTNVIDTTTSGNTIVYQEYAEDTVKYWTNYAILNKLDYNYKAFDSDFSGLVATSGWWVDASYDTGIVRTVSGFWNKKARLVYSNPTAGPLKLYYNNIYGNVWYKSTERVSTVDNTTVSGQKLDQYVSTFIYDKTFADIIALNLAAQHAVGGITYTIYSDDLVDVGDLVTVDMEDGTDQKCMVVEQSWKEQEERYTYKLRAYSQDIGTLSRQYVSTAGKLGDQEQVYSTITQKSITVAAALNGAVSDYSAAYVDMFVYRGDKNVTYNWTYSATTSGILGSFGTGTQINRYTVSGFNSLATISGSFILTANRSGFTPQTQTIFVYKNYAQAAAEAAIQRRFVTSALVAAATGQYDDELVYCEQTASLWQWDLGTTTWTDTGAVAPSSTNLAAAWLGNETPEIPDNAAGTVYVNDNKFVNTSGWAINAGAPVSTFNNGTWNIVGDAASEGYYKSVAAGATVRLRVRVNSGTLAVNMSSGGSRGYTLTASADWVICDIYAASAANIRMYGIADWDVCFVYIGSALYDTPDIDNSGHGLHLIPNGTTPDGNGNLIFDGANDYLKSSAIIATVPDEMFFAFDFPNGHAQTADSQALVNYKTGGAGFYRVRRLASSNTLRVDYWNGVTATYLDFADVYTGYTSSKIAPYIYVNWSTGAVKAFRNGAQFGATQTMTTPVKPTAGSYLYFGSYQGTAHPLAGTMGPILMYSRLPSDQEIRGLSLGLLPRLPYKLADWRLDPTNANNSVTVYAPKNLGRYLAAHPTSYNNGDWWTVYDTDDSPITRGVYYSDAGTPTRITTASAANLVAHLGSAMADIAWAEEQGTYGTSSDYGIDTLFTSLGAVTAFFTSIFAQDIMATGTIAGLVITASSYLTVGTGAAIYSSDGHVAINGDGADNTFGDGICLANYNMRTGTPGATSVKISKNIYSDIAGYYGVFEEMRFGASMAQYPHTYDYHWYDSVNSRIQRYIWAEWADSYSARLSLQATAGGGYISLEAFAFTALAGLAISPILMSVYPVATNTISLGTSTYKWKDGYFLGNLLAEGQHYSATTDTASTSMATFFTPALGEVGLLSLSDGKDGGPISALYFYARDSGGTMLTLLAGDGTYAALSGTAIQTKASNASYEMECRKIILCTGEND